ncbi:hypothetical protein [Kitasatospora sp. NPDC085464]|uniref:hypothetical protein n=1 Tax=Kitasatospora sp. NPDC085464 TaxID=3364063 RepID=UPI0037C8324F
MTMHQITDRWPLTIDRKHYTGLPDPPRTEGLFLRGNNAAVHLGRDLEGHRLHPPQPKGGQPQRAAFSSTYPVHPDDWPEGVTFYATVMFFPNTQMALSRAAWEDNCTADVLGEWMAGAREIALHLETLGYSTGLRERLHPPQDRRDRHVLRSVMAWRTDGFWDEQHRYHPGDGLHPSDRILPAGE